MGITQARQIKRLLNKEKLIIQESEENITKARKMLKLIQTKDNNDLAFFGLVLVLIILSALIYITIQMYFPITINYDYAFNSPVQIIEKNISNTNNYQFEIPEGKQETCIQLKNETFRRCFGGK